MFMLLLDVTDKAIPVAFWFVNYAVKTHRQSLSLHTSYGVRLITAALTSYLLNA